MLGHQSRPGEASESLLRKSVLRVRRRSTEGVPPPPSTIRPTSDEEEARLRMILLDSAGRVSAASQALLSPVHSVLLPEYRQLQTNLSMARVECAKALVTF
jgi:hypothetical protein